MRSRCSTLSKVELTTAGEAFLEHVRPALFHLERAREEAVAVRDAIRAAEARLAGCGRLLIRKSGT